MKDTIHYRSTSRRLIFCSRFQGLITGPGQLAVKVKVPVIIEVYKRGVSWYARERVTQRDWPGIKAPDADSCMVAIRAKFEEQIGEWEAYDMNGKRVEELPPELSDKAVSTPRDNYGWRSSGRH